jgi:hypothetical protein
MIWQCLSADAEMLTKSPATRFDSNSTAQSAQRLPTGWTVRGLNPGGSKIFRTCPDRLWGPPTQWIPDFSPRAITVLPLWTFMACSKAKFTFTCFCSKAAMTSCSTWSSAGISPFILQGSCPVHSMKAFREADVQPHSFLISTLGGGQWSPSRPPYPQERTGVITE